jgi:hypothetical protein
MKEPEDSPAPVDTEGGDGVAADLPQVPALPELPAEPKPEDGPQAVQGMPNRVMLSLMVMGRDTVSAIVGGESRTDMSPHLLFGTQNAKEIMVGLDLAQQLIMNTREQVKEQMRAAMLAQVRAAGVPRGGPSGIVGRGLVKP